MILSEIETASRDELAALGLERLHATVERVLTSVPPGAARLREAGIESAAEIRSLEDLRRLPFSMKADLREHYPFGLLAVPRERLARVHASSGTGGKPTVVGYTAHDLEIWSEVMARCLTSAGVRPGMLVHNANGYGLFTGGLGFQMGAERLGATVIPVSSGMTARQALLLRDLGGQALCATPSYALHIAQVLRDSGVAIDELSLEVGLFGGEPWTEEMRERLSRELGLVPVNVYGLSEIVGPGVAAECREALDGLHICEDHFLAEVIDPVTTEPLAPGEEGELVFTTLSKEAMPLIRYRTGDIASLSLEPCACGRTLARMSAVRGRRDDMLIIRGVNVYPSEIERLLLTVEGLGPHYQLVVDRPGDMDELTVHCEPAEHRADRAALAARAHDTLREGTGLSMTIDLRQPGEVPRSEGKAVRVVDRRVGVHASTDGASKPAN